MPIDTGQAEKKPRQVCRLLERAAGRIGGIVSLSSWNGQKKLGFAFGFEE